MTGPLPSEPGAKAESCTPQMADPLKDRETPIIGLTAGILLSIAILLIAALPYLSSQNETASRLYAWLITASLPWLLLAAVAGVGSACVHVARHPTRRVAFASGMTVILVVFTSTLALVSQNQRRASLVTSQDVYAGPGGLFLVGHISPDSFARLRALAITYAEPIDLVLLSNAGGDIVAARRIADNLDQLNVRRVVADQMCASACAELWLRAPNRALAPYSIIGIHSPHSDSLRPLPDDISVLQSVLTKAGFTTAEAVTIANVPASRMAFFSAADLQSRGILFEPVQTFSASR